MGFRFQRRIKIAPGIRLNIGKTGVSTTLGKPGASVNVNKDGIRGSAGLPGTGLSTQTQITNWQGKTPEAAPRARRLHPLLAAALGVGIVLSVWLATF